MVWIWEVLKESRARAWGVMCWMLVVGCGAHSIDDHADENYDEIDGHIYAWMLYLISSVLLF